jgi:EpsI family protein
MMRFALVSLMLVATAAYVLLHPPENLALGRAVLARCPASFGEWNGTDLSFENAVVEELDADDLLVRRYERGEDVAWLCVIYHRNKRYGAHDPQLCYESQGYVVERESRERVDDGTPGGLEVNRFIADRPRDRRLVYYWYRAGGLTTANVEAMRRQMALAGAIDNRSWGAFVRVETKVRERDDAAAAVRLADFAARVADGLPAVFDDAGRDSLETR